MLFYHTAKIRNLFHKCIILCLYLLHLIANIPYIVISSKGSEFKRLGVQRLGVQKAQQAEKVLTSSKTGKVLVLCSADVGSPSALLHRGAEKAGTGIRGSPRTGRGRKNSARGYGGL